MESPAFKSECDVDDRVRQPFHLGDNRDERAPNAVADAVVQPAVHIRGLAVLDRRVLLRHPDGVGADPSATTSEHAYPMWRKRRLWWVRLGPVSRVCCYHVTTTD